MIKKFLFSILVITSTFSLAANNFERVTLYPTKTDIPPIIDGDLSEDLWKKAIYVTTFKTFIPDFGKEIPEKTIAYLAYDRDNLYFAFKCLDSEPDKIKASITARDQIQSEDFVCVNIDTHNDHQSLTAFYVNPLGIQMDSRFMNGIEDYNFDLVWFSNGKIDEEGYTIEIQIPLKSIRYSKNDSVEMSIMLERKISRRSEHASFPELDPAKGFAFLNQLNPVVFYDLKEFTLLEILPAFTYINRSSYKEGKLTNDLKKADGHISIKYGITSNLVLDATYNPDFSQIESDAGQIDINLRNSLFFPEKRSFFLEGSEIFNMGAIGSSQVDPISTLLHTRTIVNPIFGVKLTGKIGEKNNISILYSKDELPKVNEKYQFAHFPIVRYKRGFNDDSFIGFMLSSKESDDLYNRVGGIDGVFRLTPASKFSFHAISNESKVLESNVPEIKKGFAIGILYELSNRDHEYSFSYKDISKDFNAEMGYIKRTGLQIFTGSFKKKIYPKTNFFRTIEGELLISLSNDKFYNMWETFNYLSTTANFLGNALFIAKYYLSTEIYINKRYKTNGFHALFANQFTKSIVASILFRWNNGILYGNNPQSGKTFRFTGNIIYKPSDKISSELNYIYAQFISNPDNVILYTYPITRFKLTYQLNKYLFIRGITEYNNYSNTLMTDFLASFTYIPGTVVHLGYGSVYEKSEWDDLVGVERETNHFIEHNRGFFFKVSYMWRL